MEKIKCNYNPCGMEAPSIGGGERETHTVRTTVLYVGAILYTTLAYKLVFCVVLIAILYSNARIRNHDINYVTKYISINYRLTLL